MLNSCCFTGRLTADPELATGATTPRAKFTLAVQRSRKGQDGERPTDFFGFTAFGSTAEYLTKYFSKGDWCAVSGRAELNSWDDAQGNRRKMVEFIAENVSHCGPRQPQEGSEVQSGEDNPAPTQKSPQKATVPPQQAEIRKMIEAQVLAKEALTEIRRAVQFPKSAEATKEDWDRLLLACKEAVEGDDDPFAEE